VFCFLCKGEREHSESFRLLRLGNIETQPSANVAFHQDFVNCTVLYCTLDRSLRGFMQLAFSRMRLLHALRLD
jgi:hypothetical protein